MKDPAHTRSVALLLLAALCWSLGGVLIKWVQWPPLAVASLGALPLAGQVADAAAHAVPARVVPVGEWIEL